MFFRQKSITIVASEKIGKNAWCLFWARMFPEGNYIGICRVPHHSPTIPYSPTVPVLCFSILSVGFYLLSTFFFSGTPDLLASPQTSCGVCFCSWRIHFSPRTSAKHSRHLRSWCEVLILIFFFRLLLSNCLNWKIHCDDHSLLSFTFLFVWISQ